MGLYVVCRCLKQPVVDPEEFNLPWSLLLLKVPIKVLTGVPQGVK